MDSLHRFFDLPGLMGCFPQQSFIKHLLGLDFPGRRTNQRTLPPPPPPLLPPRTPGRPAARREPQGKAAPCRRGGGRRPPGRSAPRGPLGARSAVPRPSPPRCGGPAFWADSGPRLWTAAASLSSRVPSGLCSYPETDAHQDFSSYSFVLPAPFLSQVRPDCHRKRGNADRQKESKK